jgi:hypothetical protein
MLRSIPFRNLNPAETGPEGRDALHIAQDSNMAASLRDGQDVSINRKHGQLPGTIPTKMSISKLKSMRKILK